MRHAFSLIFHIILALKACNSCHVVILPHLKRWTYQFPTVLFSPKKSAPLKILENLGWLGLWIDVTDKLKGVLVQRLFYQFYVLLRTNTLITLTPWRKLQPMDVWPFGYELPIVYNKWGTVHVSPSLSARKPWIPIHAKSFLWDDETRLPKPTSLWNVFQHVFSWVTVCKMSHLFLSLQVLFLQAYQYLFKYRAVTPGIPTRHSTGLVYSKPPAQCKFIKPPFKSQLCPSWTSVDLDLHSGKEVENSVNVCMTCTETRHEGWPQILMT